MMRCVSSTVKEVMSREVFSFRPDDTALYALNGFFGFGILGAPVLDAGEMPIGFLSMRDLVVRKGPTVRSRMSFPAMVVRANALITDAATLMGETGYRLLVVIDDKGRTAGMLSSLDVIRGLAQLPVSHPAVSHLFGSRGVRWSDDASLDAERVAIAPDCPGMLLLISSEPGLPDAARWAESVSNLRIRLREMLSIPQHNPELSRLLEHGNHLRFRSAFVTEPDLHLLPHWPTH
jgi:predicted transcriptional regulator